MTHLPLLPQNKLLEEENAKLEPEVQEPKSKKAVPKKRGVKRQSPDAEGEAPRKRQRKSIEDSEKPKKKRKSQKTAVSAKENVGEAELEPKTTKKRGRKQKKAISADEDDELSSPLCEKEEDVVQPQPKPRRKGKASKVAAEDDGDSLSDVLPEGEVPEAEPEPKKAKLTTKQLVSDDDDLSDPPTEGSDPARENGKKGEIEVITDASFKQSTGKEDKSEENGDVDVMSQYSDVKDEDPKPQKRGRKSNSSSNGPKQKSPKEATARKRSKSTPSKAFADASPDDQELKKLQGQLVKCGVRKIWQFELKQYGDNSKAKIRHLRKMLTDIGMEGRFSEAKAAAIKEQRELMADLLAVQEGDRHWGVSGRASRSRTKMSYKAEPGSDEEADAHDGHEEEDEEDDGLPKGGGKWRDQQKALAALLDDGDSDD